MNILALEKGEEKYIFLFGNQDGEELNRTLGRFAANPDLSFTWYDASVLSQKMRQILENEGGD